MDAVTLRVRIADLVVGRPYRAWREVVSWGTDGVDPVRARSVAGGNRFFVLAAFASIPGIVYYLSYSAQIATHPGITRLTILMAWLLCLWLNRRRAYTWAAVLGITVPLVGFTYLSLLFSRHGGFQIPLLAISGLCFVLFVPSQWRLRLGFFVATTAALIWVYTDPRFAEAPDGIRSDRLAWAAAFNVFFTAVFIYVVAWFDIHGFMRERRRNDMLLHEAHVAAQTDSLTSLLNRRGVTPLLDRVVQDGDYCLALMDLDRFKRVNDRLGHGAGDEVLAHVARTLATTGGSRGQVARWGGEEFLMILPGATLEAAMTVVEEVRAAVQEECVVDGLAQHVTVSIGVVSAAQGTEWESAVQDADARLYEAKASGRNAVVGGTVAER